MNKLVVEGAGAQKQIICAERSSKTIIAFVLLSAGLFASIVEFQAVDPVAHPALWFYACLGILVCGLGCLATGWLIINPGAIRIELDESGLVQRGILWSRRYSWSQLGPFAPVEQSMRANVISPKFASWYAGAFSSRTMDKMGSVRAPEDDELHAADIYIHPALLERGPKLKTTRRFCDILNEWRSAALGEDGKVRQQDQSVAERSSFVRRRIQFCRVRMVSWLILATAVVVCGPMIVERLFG